MAESSIALGKMDDKDSATDLEPTLEEEVEESSGFYAKHKSKFGLAFKLILLAGWIAFLGYGIYYATSVDPEHDVIWYWLALTLIYVFFWALGKWVMPHIKKVFVKVRESFGRWNDKNQKWTKWLYILIVLAYVFGTALGGGIGDMWRFTSLAGWVAYLLLIYIFSAHRRQVRWRPVIAGLIIQYTMALLILKTFPGRWLFTWMGDIVNTFLGCVASGSAFVFGDGYGEHFFAFSVIPTICFFSSFTSIMYYLGVMSFIITRIAGFLQIIIGTSAAETLSAAGNIFVGQTEAPLLVKPFIGDMTKSEIHAVMTGGFATVAGGVMAAFIGMGVSAEHLMAASVMAAPGALAMSKLSYPETEQSKTAQGTDFEVPRGNADSVLEAAANGAADSVPLMLNVGAMLIAFLSLLEAVNQILHSIGGCFGLPTLSVEWICQYLFLPFAYLLGVQGDDALQVATLVGKKMILNEFVGYTALSELLTNRKCGREPQMSERAEVISTYAMCGFANFSSIGIQLGGLTPLAPHRARDFSHLVFRAMLTGTTVSFMTANIAGFLYEPSGIEYGPPYPDTC